MQLYRIFKKLFDYKILLSVIGAFCVSTGSLMIGHIIWLFASVAWLYYFIRQQDHDGILMYVIWVIQAIVGIFYYGFWL